MNAIISLAAEGDMLSVTEAARVLGVSTSTIWRWIGQSRVPAYRLGPKRVRLKRSDLECLAAPVRASRSDPAMEPPIRPLSDDERRRGLEFVERARRRLAAQLAARGGVPFENSWELLHELRMERLERLG